MHGADQQSRQAEHRHELEVARLQAVAAGSPAAGGEASRFPSSCRRAWRGAGSSRYRRSRPACGHDSIWCAVPSGLPEVRICSRVDPLQLGVSEYQEPATKGTPGVKAGAESSIASSPAPLRPVVPPRAAVREAHELPQLHLVIPAQAPTPRCQGLERTPPTFPQPLARRRLFYGQPSAPLSRAVAE